MVLGKRMITVIYYTSNREEELFENKIKGELLIAIGELPLISVSQKPIDFGHNICVGDIGTSDENVLRQMLIGCEEAETDFVAMAEADCLYPPTGYFDFIPNDLCYRHINLWIYNRGSKYYKKKAYSLCAQIANRKYLIDRIKKKMYHNFKRGDIVKKTEWIPFESEVPCINIKTGKGMRRFTGTIKGINPVRSLPYWGSTKELEERL